MWDLWEQEGMKCIEMTSLVSGKNCPEISDLMFYEWNVLLLERQAPFVDIILVVACKWMADIVPTKSR